MTQDNNNTFMEFILPLLIIIGIVIGVMALVVPHGIIDSINSYEENNIVDRNRDYGIILFTASWCKVCQEIKPEVDRLNENGAGIAIFNADESPEITKQNNITVFPTFIVYDNRGEILRTHNIVDIYKIMEKLK